MNGFVFAPAPLLPWPFLTVLAVAALAVFLFSLRQKAKGAWFRAALLVALLLVLLNPSILQERRAPVKDVAAVIVDDTLSQSLGARRTRTDTALQALTAKLAAFEDLDVRTLRVKGMTESDLAAAIAQAFSDVPPRRIAGTVLLSDGQVHDVPDDPAQLAAYGPVHALLSGDHGERDRRLVLVRVPAFGLVDQVVTVTVRIEDPSAPQGDAATLSVRQPDGQNRALTARIGEDFTFDVPVAHAGANVFEIGTETPSDDVTPLNNHAVIAVNGVRERLRVLLVSGEPHAGERTWRNLLKADPAVDLVHFTILRPPEKQDRTPLDELALIPFPVHQLFEMKLRDFDLIIFDRFRRQNLLPPRYMENIAAYVEEGGALFDASGTTYAEPQSLAETALARILPTEPLGTLAEKSFLPTLTADGKKHPVTAPLAAQEESGPWGHWFRQANARAIRGTVVMTGADNQPLLVLDRVGEGRVAQLLSDQIWLWSRGFEGGGPQADLLRHIAHWLMKEPELEENTLRAQVQTGTDGYTLTLERQSVKEDGAPVTLTFPDGHEESLTLSESPQHPGLRQAVRTVVEPGIYRAGDGTATTMIAVGDLKSPELGDMRTSDQKLAPLAKATGGAVRWLVDDGAPDIRRTSPRGSQNGSGWLGLRRNGDYTVTGADEYPLLPNWLALIVLLALALATWRREGG